MPILDVKKIGGAFGDVEERVMRLLVPAMWGSNEVSERLKSTCHPLSKSSCQRRSGVYILVRDMAYG